jgi:Tol biopolymer transport system component
LLLIGSPAISPDGKQVAFAASTGLARSPFGPGWKGAAAAQHPTLQDVFVVNTDGTNLTLVAEIADQQPSIDWSADGKFVYSLGAGGFWKIAVETKSLEQIGAGVPGGLIRIFRNK